MTYQPDRDNRYKERCGVDAIDDPDIELCHHQARNRWTNDRSNLENQGIEADGIREMFADTPSLEEIAARAREMIVETIEHAILSQQGPEPGLA